jgi:hypothetical protein
MNEKAQDRPVSEGGRCILYTHFGFRFVNRGKLDETFARLMKRLASLGGFFAPASALLDFLREHAEWNPSIIGLISSAWKCDDNGWLQFSLASVLSLLL